MEKTDLKLSLPPYVTDIYEMRCLLDAVSLEIDRLYEQAAEVFSNLSLKKCRSRIELWEREFSIEGSGSFEDRKKAVLAKMGVLGTQTRSTVKALFESLVPKSTAEITEKNGSIIVNVETEGDITPSVLYVMGILEEYLPAHIKCTYSAVSCLYPRARTRVYSYAEMEIDFKLGEEI